ncbi:MAG: DUF2914 domain-containing protein [Oligoflexia bacterium]|nr:DUF2914 domain-containing protein [Oligoflexia bacterium]
MKAWKEKISTFAEKYDLQLSAAFFIGGFLWDIFLLSDIDDPLSIGQQFFYLVIVGWILERNLLIDFGSWNGPKSRIFIQLWKYRVFVLHFLLGSLLSVYSLFYIKSASIFASAGFLVFMLLILVANESKLLQESSFNLKIALFVLCIFSFFAILFPVILGFVGWIPFILSVVFTLLWIWISYKRLASRVDDKKKLFTSFFGAGGGVVACFTIFYALGWIPPVPLSVEKMGIYHDIKKVDGVYELYHERAWWKFWQKGDQDFRALPGDRIYVFASVFSPARFDDTVILHWFFKDEKQGWVSTDKIPMNILGGRAGGYRGNAVKKHYQEGDWRISVETRGGTEIGRIYFQVEKIEGEVPERLFSVEKY